ncbi:MAG: hypothetical protein CMG69_01765 [Candidatus Marinimicrobia bacterium]|nr:hypothetical protein [Candidatus Neomarinimicrobiota bacterium]|tara:strand:+ start:179799 stop:180167 length:369 start_codon:yes stop_codon:yes gene_type:complete
MKYGILFLCLVTLGFAQTKQKADNFLNIKVQDALVQGEIDALRKDYLDQKKEIMKGYNERIKSLKEMQKSDVKTLRKPFREKLKELRKKNKHVKFPEKPKKEKPELKSKEKSNKEKQPEKGL